MLVLGPLLILIAIGFFCWLLFTLAVFALPFFVGLTVGVWAFHTGSGVLGGILVGAAAGGATFGVGQFALAFAPWTWLRVLTIVLFVAPATGAGYSATHGIAQIAVPSATWQMIFSVIGAIAVSVTTFRHFDLSLRYGWRVLSCGRPTALPLFLQPHAGAAAILRNEFDAGLLKSGAHAVDRRQLDPLATLETSHGVGGNLRQIGEFDDAEIQSGSGHSALDGRHSRIAILWRIYLIGESFGLRWTSLLTSERPNEMELTPRSA